MDLNLKVAGKFNKPPFELWDFATYSRYTMEAFPSNDEDTMNYHWETSHYKKELGDLVLKSISESSQDFGQILTAQNINNHLASQVNARLSWSKADFDIRDFQKTGFTLVNDILIDDEIYFPKISSVRYRNVNEVDSGKALEVTGSDAYIIYDFDDVVNGDLVDYVGMNFSCVERKGKASKIQMFWWDNSQQWFSEKFSVTSSIEDGLSIINLDNDKNWNSSTSIRSIRIDVPNRTVCGKVKLEGLFYGSKAH